MDQQDVLAYTPVEGDFKITADLHTMKRSDPSQAPVRDGTILAQVLVSQIDHPLADNGAAITVCCGSAIQVYRQATEPAEPTQCSGMIWNH